MKDKSTPPKSQTSLDRNQLRDVREKYLRLNEYRLRFAQGLIPDNQQLYLDLLPALLHFNHPMLPGYCDRKTPSGIYQYHASETTCKRLKRLAKSFHPNRSKNLRPDILSVFTMGSLGSSAQNTSSDIDVWLCYRTDLPVNSITLLKEKVNKITEWADNFGIDTTIFLMNHKDFNAGVIQSLDKESSGSTQHCLLLDEFYRTAIYLCGQLPAWLFISQNNNTAYNKEVETLLEEKRLPDKHLIDFGTLDKIPNGEFIGAAIWQLYKAIGSPYKSLIKLMLIEIYATHNDTQHFLSNQFKHWLQIVKFGQEISLEDYDPYFKTYALIESYLTAAKQENRLELVRRCFYFKVAHPLTKNNNTSVDTKHKLIKQLTQQWGWSQNTINELNHREHWKIDRVTRERRLIINALNESYRFIIDFFRQSNIEISASNKELNILGRKLHAAFSKKAGKVDWINPGISSNITEDSIFIDNDHHKHWFAKNKNQQTIQEKTSLLELLVNLHCNQIINSKTKIHLENSEDLPINKIFENISATIPSPLSPAQHNYFENKCFTAKVVLFIHSFEKPDYFFIPDQPEQQAYYLTQHCKIDTIIINSWNEIVCQQDQGRADYIIPKILSQFLNEPTVFDNIHHCFFDENISQTLQFYIINLKSDLKKFLMANPCGQFLLKNKDGYITLSNSTSVTPFTQHPTINQLYQSLSEPHHDFCALAVDQHTLKDSPLAVFARFNRDNCIQIFFEVKKPNADITIIDEQGSFYFLKIPYHNSQQSLLPIYAYCRSVNERRLSHSTMDVSPLDILPISIFELRKKESRWHTTQVYLNNQATNDQQFTIHGVAEYREKEFIFTLYCDEQRFSEDDDQAAAFKKMLTWMRSQSKGNKKGPKGQPNYTIADLDISHCQQAFAPGESLHTTHYLRVKSELEKKLQQVLR